MSHIKDLIVNGVTRVLGKLIANRMFTDSITAITASNRDANKCFNTNGDIHRLAFIPGTGNNSAKLNGSTSVASKNYSVAEGYGSTASGPGSHAEGVDTTASGDYSHAEGYNTTASGNYSHAEGVDTQASEEGSHASGIGTIASHPAMTAIGQYNSFPHSNYDDLFAVGYGKKEGNTTQLRTVFDILGDGKPGSSGRCSVNILGDVTVQGKINASQGFFQTSDERQKNITGELDLDKAYELIDKCQTILYTLKDDKNSNQQVGLIAQEVKEFFQELITEDNDGNLSLDYSRLTVIILRVLKDVINRVKKLEDK